MDLSSVLTVAELVGELVTTVSCGGNLLVNVGPDLAGHIAPVFQERLLQLGDWMQVNQFKLHRSFYILKYIYTR